MGNNQTSASLNPQSRYQIDCNILFVIGQFFSNFKPFFPFVSRNGTKRFFRYLSTIGRMAALALGVSERRGLQIKNASNDAQKQRHEKKRSARN